MKVTKSKLNKFSKQELRSFVVTTIQKAFNEGTIFEAGVDALTEKYATKKAKIELILSLFHDELDVRGVNDNEIEEAKNEIIERIEYSDAFKQENTLYESGIKKT